MADLISRHAAVDAVENIDCSDGVGISALKCEAVDDGVTAIKALPPAQPEKHTQERTETHACDLISRAMLLEYIHNEPVGKMLCDKYNLDGVIKQLPSAQPDVPDTNVGDMISRQAAIDALDEQIEQCNKALGSFGISPKDEYAIKVERASLKAYKEQLENMPAAQPKRGKWIYGEDLIADGVDGYRCDQCGFFVPWDYTHKSIDYIKDYNFCPKCGSYNGGEQDG